MIILWSFLEFSHRHLTGLTPTELGQEQTPRQTAVPPFSPERSSSPNRSVWIMVTLFDNRIGKVP